LVIFLIVIVIAIIFGVRWLMRPAANGAPLGPVAGGYEDYDY
jgi:hypothetical protein